MAAAAKITKAFINVTEAPLMGLITTVNISMNPFDKRSVRAKFVIWNFIVCYRRSLYAYFTSRTIKEQNTKFKVISTLHDTNAAPILEVTYQDNSKKIFDTTQHNSSVLLEMHKHNLALDRKGVQIPNDYDS